MKINKYIVSIGITSLMILSSCNDFLSEAPDNRTELTSTKNIAKLLVSGYSTGNYALLTEFSSDNIRDNNSPDKNGVRYNLNSFDRINEEIYAWEPGVSNNTQDSPTFVWDGCYYAIAVANNALVALEKLEEEGVSPEELNPLKGEALLIRAYHHFVLVNLFSHAYRNETLSNDPVSAQGIPYVTEPETTVQVHYNRGTVTSVYKAIEEDLEEGLPLISDNAYDVPKYHFNKKAAYAFAARFYLFKRDYKKVIEYATNVLGNDPSALLRDWTRFGDISSADARVAEWCNADNDNNLLLIATGSNFDRAIAGVRYGCTGDAAAGSLDGSGPTWSGSPKWFQSAGMYYRDKSEYGLFLPKVMEFFEYTDKVAGIGFPHIVRCEFTAEETLLCRAEAYALSGNIPAAVQDLKCWDTSHQKTTATSTVTELTLDRIKRFYTEDKTFFSFEFHTTDLSPDFVVTAEQKPVVDCILHYRRLETMFDGMRWFDLKRYGIEISHRIGKDEVRTLTWNDERRAFQLPAEVIAAGGEPTTRTETKVDAGILYTGK